MRCKTIVIIFLITLCSNLPRVKYLNNGYSLYAKVADSANLAISFLFIL